MGTRYKTVPSLSIPRYNDEGKITTSNHFVRGGDLIPEGALDQKHHAEFLRRGLESGAIREVEDPAETELESAEGSEVNGPGTAVLQTFPVVSDPDAKTEHPVEDGGEYPVRPNDNDSTEKWSKYAESRGLDGSGKRAEIQARVRHLDEEEAAANGE